MKKEMLINVLQPEESRIAIVEDGVLEELYVERTSHESYVGNIYKGRIVNIEPSIQAAFVDFGVGRNGFLHVSDVEPAYYRHLEGSQNENGNRRRKGGGSRSGRRSGGRRDDRDDSRSDDFTDQFEERVDTDDEMIFEDEIVIDEDGKIVNHNNKSERSSDDFNDSDAETNGEEKSVTIDDVDVESADDDPQDTFENETEAGNADDQPDDEKAESEDAELIVESSNESNDTESDKIAVEPVAEIENDDVGRDDAGPSSAVESDDEDDDERENFGSTSGGASGNSAVPTLQKEPTSSTSSATMVMPSTERRTEMLDAPSAMDDDDSDFGDEDLSFSMRSGADDDEVDDEPSNEVQVEETEKDDDFDERPTEKPRRDRNDNRRNDDRRNDRRGGRDGSRRNSSRSDGGQGNRGRGGPRGPRRQGFGRPKPLIQDIFKKGQEVLVQVIKEGIGTKGPTLSTYISIAGRYLVLMPGLNRIGVSRKIEDEEQRRRLRDVLHELEPPKGLGFIIRTAGIDRTKKDLQRDLGYLSRLWQVVVQRIRKLKGPTEIYQESDMITRTIRDTFSGEINTIWVDHDKAFEHAQEFLQIVMPRFSNRIKHYNESVPMFHKYGIENEISRIQLRTVPLQHGGSIVIDQTEALVAIDVNSGSFRADNNAEETAFQMNLLAAREIARQLRLRDLGGVIVNDFIDMRDEKHRRAVERELREAVKRDRARTKILKISSFGIIEMTRQRIRPSLKRSVYQDCPHCLGGGQVKSSESMSIDVMRLLQLAGQKKNINRLDVHVHEDVAHYLQNRKRKKVADIEKENGVDIAITGEPNVAPETLEFFCYDNNNNEVKFLTADEPRPAKRRRD